MQFLQFRYNLQLSATTCTFVLLFLTCTNIQLCKAHWWTRRPTSTTTIPTYQIQPTTDPSCEPSKVENNSTAVECARPCRFGDPPKKCYYRFVIEYYTTNSRACDFCQPPVNDSRINSTCQCIISDGFEKTVFSINRMIPGPSIQVCLGDTIIIDVVNAAEGLEVAIHWHGIFQNGFQYYDGVPYVTQCPIMSDTTFRYAFQVNNPGTHYYHSHLAAHMIDGQYGSLIVREPPSNDAKYDMDLPEHVCVISDLFHEITMERFPGRYRSRRGQVAENFLINGRGDWTDPVTGVSNNISLSTFIVESGTSYRFRVINACGTVCPIALAIENHAMLIIATDGEDVEPRSANMINMASGERVDFVLFANQTPGQYWISVQGLGECQITGIYQLAILSYQGSSQSSLSSKPRYSDLPQNVVETFNPLNSTDCDDNICMYDICKENMSAADEELLSAVADVTILLSFNFFNYSSSLEYLNTLFNTSQPDYKKFFVAIDGSYLSSMMNNYTFVSSSTTLISPNCKYEVLCGNRYTPPTCTEPCTCTQVYHIKLHSVVDVMIYDKQPLQELNHPFHLHGYNFCVMYSGQFNNVSDPSFITDKDAEREMEAYRIRVQKNDFTCCAPKDTVIVPNSGYAIIRFKADNPGWWFFHCHFSWHTMSGMNLIFHIGEPKDLPPVPAAFPKCYNWAPQN